MTSRVHLFGSCLAGIAALTTMLTACGSDSPASPSDGNVVSVCVPSGSVEGWRFTRFGMGVKPAIVVGADGTIHATFMNEAMDGWVRYASLSAGASSPGQSELIADGYFYGPIDILLAGDGQPRILYHDHDREDQVLAIRSGSGFTLQPMTNAGHHGWYNTGVIGPDGTLHTATYDPSGFSGLGLNYGAWDGSSWNIELAAPGSFDYKGGTAVGVPMGRTWVPLPHPSRVTDDLPWRVSSPAHHDLLAGTPLEGSDVCAYGRVI